MMTFIKSKRIGSALIVVLIGGGWGIFMNQSHPLSAPTQTRMHQTFSKQLQNFTQIQLNTAKSQQPLYILKEILTSRNDNDPRLDSDFNHLSREDKKKFEMEYNQLRPELRNEKGTILYLLGKNLSETEDFDFLAQVLNEPPCRSLNDCTQAVASTSGHSQEASGMTVTLAYPQMVTLTVLSQYLKEHPGSPYQDQIKILLDVSKTSAHQPVREFAAALTSKR
jgi:hypothetical protein